MGNYFPADLLDHTDRLCTGSRRYTAIRAALLDLEAEGHRAGWDAPVNNPMLFAIERDLITGQTQVRLPTMLNVTLQLGLEMGDGEPGGVLTQLAEAYEAAQDAIGPPRTRTPEGIEFYGYAFRSEGWATPLNPDEQAHEAARAHELDRYPGRIEIRQVYLAGRDGLAWWVLRHRGQPPELIAALPEAQNWAQAGRIPNALTRMTNALTGSHAPVPPQDLPEDATTGEREERSP